jgi:hypothetical protein
LNSHILRFMLRNKQGRPKGEAAQALALGPTKNQILLMYIRPPKNIVHMIYRPRDQNFV